MIPQVTLEVLLAEAAERRVDRDIGVDVVRVGVERLLLLDEVAVGQALGEADLGVDPGVQRLGEGEQLPGGGVGGEPRLVVGRELSAQSRASCSWRMEDLLFQMAQSSTSRS
jgi:hypothetical protein